MVNNSYNDVKTFLEIHQISYDWHEHPAVYTVAEAAEKAGDMPKRYILKFLRMSEYAKT